MNIFKRIQENILFIFTLFLLAFIPLYPKIPLLDIRNTWVYVRVEDFIVVSVLIIWSILLFKRKVTLKTPLTIPILFFWLAGALATIHGVLLIFPILANVFPNVAFLSFLRRIEYLSLFFVAFSGIKEKKHLKYIIAALSITFLLVVGYGVGQRYLGFPAYLTMNEEFAKGEPITLSRLSRVPSTFAGHYDLAAYIVLIVPIFASLYFGVKKWITKILLAILVALGFLLMFMTVSRVSFFVLVVSLALLVMLQRKKIILFVLPLVLVVPFLLLAFAPSLANRFSSTVNEVDVLIDARTGSPIGHAKIVNAEHFRDKIVVQDFNVKNTKIKDTLLENELKTISTYSAELDNQSELFIPYYKLPSRVTLLIPSNISTGENLPQGTGYINLSLSPVVRKIGGYFYEIPDGNSESQIDAIIINGNFIVKRATAYDLSFTTRFQGEWPHAIKAFMRNIIFGSGYGSISLAIDNNYLRILGEVGALGALAFIAIFIAAGVYIKKVLPHVDSDLTKSYVVGFGVGVLGLALNAVFIDVFEASKVAFVLWLLTGVTLGTLHLYQKTDIDIYSELKKAAVSTPAIVIYLLFLSLFLYSQKLNNYFVGDDFTWFRWVVENNNILNFFTEAEGFFYRPGTKLYFLSMYKVFWLNQTVYHAVSLGLHYLVTVMVFITAKNILRNVPFAALASFMFLFMSGSAEAIFWISSTGFLFTSLFMLASLNLYLIWLNNKRRILLFFILIFITSGLLFHELGIVTPFLLIAFQVINNLKTKFSKISIWSSALLFIPIIFYILIRFTSNSHWSGGDYSYNILKLPFNTAGNLIGYSLLTIFGPITLNIYQQLRDLLRGELLQAFIIATIGLVLVWLVGKKMINSLSIEDKKILLNLISLIFLGLLPFLGLGNIASRYSYFSASGFVILIAFILMKIYEGIKNQGKDIATICIALIMSFFLLLHLMQLQDIQNDWKTAGRKTENFLTSVDEVSADYWRYEKMTLYFVNTPIKTGEAWIFPVGIGDALWFSFRNPKIIVNNQETVDQSIKLISDPWKEKVFEFKDDGKLIEHKKKIYY